MRFKMYIQMSQWRLKAFDECRASTNPNIPNALGNVEYHSKMTDKQLSSLAEYLMSNGILFRTLMTYAGMERISSEVLCRWLRPSELQRLALIMNQGELKIYRATLKLQLDPKSTPGRFVGILGANLITLTSKHNLLYAWYHNSSKNLVLYSLRKGDINVACNDDIVNDFKIDSIIEEQIGNANWGKIGQITNIKSSANVVRGKSNVTKPRSATATRSTTTTKKSTTNSSSQKKKKTFLNSRTFANVVRSKPATTKVAR